MPRTRHRAAAVLAVSLLVSACAGSTDSPTVGGAGSAPPAISTPPLDVPATAAPPSDTPPLASDLPAATPDVGIGSLTQAWAVAPLTDVATGETFRIADLAGSVVIIEPMAIWCSNCRAQQGDVQEALAQLPAGRVVYVVLDVDPNEDAASLAEYQAANGFSGRYAIAGDDVARALAADFGDQFLNPPSTPMLVVGTDGTVTRTDDGHKGTDEIVDLAQAHGA